MTWWDIRWLDTENQWKSAGDVQYCRLHRLSRGGCRPQVTSSVLGVPLAHDASVAHLLPLLTTWLLQLAPNVYFQQRCIVTKKFWFLCTSAILTKTLIGQIRSMQCCNSIRTGMFEAKAAKFCSKFPQHLFPVTFQLSQPCYVSPFINVYEVVAITTAIKQTKIANECLSFSICLYYPAPPLIQHPHIAYRHPPSRKSWPHPESSAVRLLYCCIL